MLHGLMKAAIILISSIVAVVNLHAGEISSGVSVVSSELNAPVNEQPFFGFKPKNANEIAADRQLIDSVERSGSTREAGAQRAVQVAWQAIGAGRFDEAAKRLNQAWLLQPNRSGITHLFAIIVQERFKDTPYALRLFEAAALLQEPSPTLPADHARILLISRQPKAAIPLLERAIKQIPDWAVPKANLAMAFFETGQIKEACDALSRVAGREIESVRNDMSQLKSVAKCP